LANDFDPDGPCVAAYLRPTDVSMPIDGFVERS